MVNRQCQCVSRTVCFYANRCLAVLQQKLLSSLCFGALKAYMPKSPSSELLLLTHTHTHTHTPIGAAAEVHE